MGEYNLAYYVANERKIHLIIIITRYGSMALQMFWKYPHIVHLESYVREKEKCIMGIKMLSPSAVHSNSIDEC